MQGSFENLQYQSVRPTADPKNFGGKAEKKYKERNRTTYFKPYL